jgi:hypothetical protein
MQNHWHLILWPDEDLQLSRFMHWLTTTHTQRWHGIHLSKVRDAIAHGRPFGDEARCRQMASTLGLEHTFRPEGRPRKSKTTPDP